MNNWQTKKLGEVLDGIVGGGTPSKEKPEYWNGSIAWASVKDITRFNSFGTQDYITEEGLKNSSSRLIKAGTLIMPTRMALGLTVQFAIDVAINQDLKALYIKSILHKEFLKYWFESKRSKIKKMGTGSTVDGIQVGDLKSLKINLPEKPEQQRIVSVLETWDEYLELLDKKIALKERLKKGLMQQLLTGKKRLPGPNDNFKYTILSYYAKDDKNAIVDGPFGSQMKLTEFTNHGVPVIEMYHLKNTIIDNNKLNRYVSIDKFNSDLKRSEVTDGDIVISKTGSLGYLGIFRGIDNAVITSRLAKISINEKKACTGFIFQYLKYMKEISYWERIGQGGTMKILSIGDFKKMPIPKLSLDEQLDIAAILEKLDELLADLKILRVLKVNQKKYLLKNLITGRIRTPENLTLERSL